VCPGCSFISDHVDAARQHFEHADLSFAAISRAPMPRIAEVQKRMGWQFRWVSSHGTSFNYDFGVSFTPDQVKRGAAPYNYGTIDAGMPDREGASVFYQDSSGAVFHTYSCYARGIEVLNGTYHILDLMPKGRDEDPDDPGFSPS